MDIMAVIVTLIIGAIAGWLAGVLVEGAGFGLLINMLLGIAGAFIAACCSPTGTGVNFGRRHSRCDCHLRTWRDRPALIVNLVQRLVS